MFIFKKQSIFLENDGKFPSKEIISNQEILDKIDSSVYKDEDYEAVQISEDADLSGTGLKEVTMRDYVTGNSDEGGMKVRRAKSLLNWRSENKFCSVCGGKMTEDKGFTALRCENCDRILFPRIEPCIICLVKKDDKVLLARNVNSKNGMFGCIAGFIEAGESAEHCVAREVLEETGIKIKNIRYAGTQSWPFPDQLMIAFFADYESGEIKVQEEEIAEADFYSMDNLPPLPPKGSAAWRLIFNEF